MSGFLYYLPDTVGRPRLEDLAEAGLAYVFSDTPGERNFTPIGVTGGAGGPDGKHGVIIADDRHVPKIGYYPDEQTWRKMPAALLPEARSPKPEARLVPWVGFYTADPPGPEDLLRTRPLTGHLVRMNDDREWLAPVARGWNDDEQSPGSYVALPQLTTLNDAGEWSVESVAPKYEQLWDIATRFFDDVQRAARRELGTSDDTETTFDFAGQNDDALAALQANYRIGKLEVAMLGLFTDQCTTEVLSALIDMPTFLQWVKKKPANESSESTPAG